MEQLLFDGVVPSPKPTVLPRRERLKPDAWFRSDGEQQRLAVPRTPDSASPLWYVGTKYNLYPIVMELLPAGTTSLVSPFTGGASLELRLAATGIRVYGYDKFRPIPEFFQTFERNASAVVDRTLELYPIYRGDAESREHYVWLTRGGGWEALDFPIDRAAVTWCVSAQSFRGMNFASVPVHPRHAQSREYFRKPIPGQERSWREWSNPFFSYAESDFRQTLLCHDEIAYLDPPYVGHPRYYGKSFQGTFPHEELRDMLAARGGFILSYGDDPLIRKLYQDFTILEPSWGKGTSRGLGGSARTELLILSDDLSPN